MKRIRGFTKIWEGTRIPLGSARGTGWEDIPRSFGSNLRLKVPHSVDGRIASARRRAPDLPAPLLLSQCPQKQKARCLLTAGSRIKLGTDLLSHLLRQYHRLWRA